MNMKYLAAVIGPALLAGCALFAGRGQAANLDDQTWTVSQVGSQQALAGSKLNLFFDGDGRVSGRAGCNGFSGSYELTDSVLSIGRLVRTKRMCMSAELMQQEQAFLDALQSVSSFHIDNGRLQLMDENGVVIEALLQQP